MSSFGPKVDVPSAQSGGGLCAEFGGGLDDEVGDGFGLGEHGYVAGRNFDGGGTHSFGGEAFVVGVDGAVVGGYGIPAWLGVP